MENQLNNTEAASTAETPVAEKPNKFHAIVYQTGFESSTHEIISTRSMKELKAQLRDKVEKQGFILGGVFRGTHIPAKVEMKQTVSIG